VLLTLAQVLFAMVLPRRPSGVERLTLVVNRGVRLAFVALSRLAKTYEGKDALLAPTAPVALMVQLLFWAASLAVGFALMLQPTVHSLSAGLMQSITALFTVGAVHIGGTPNTGIDIAVGAIWVVIVALQIAYLPALYGAFNRREGLVSLLESRAGIPAWGPELLARHQLVGIVDTLPDLYSDWEEWAADGAKTASAWIASRCRIPRGAARRRVRLARSLRHLPECAQAWREGAIGVDAAQAIAELEVATGLTLR